MQLARATTQFCPVSVMSISRRSRPARKPIIGDKVPVHQPLAHHPGRNGCHLRSGIQVASIVLAGELLDVAVKVFRRHLVERALVRLLESRPEGFDAVGVRHIPDVLGDAVLDALVVEGQSFVGGCLVGIDSGSRSRVLDDEALQGRLVGGLERTLATTRLLARSFAPTTATLPTAPRPVPARSFRLALLMLARRPPMYVSSTSTGPENCGSSFLAFQASRMRWSMNHAVFCVTPMSRWSFMLLMLLRLVSSR